MIGNRRDRFGPLPLEEELLDLVGLGLEAHATHEFEVKVPLLGAHAADVEAQHRLHGHQRRLHVVVDLDHHELGDLEAGLRLGEGLRVDLVPVGRIVEREPSIGDLRRESDVLGALGAQEDRYVRPQRMGDRAERLSHAPGARTGVGKRVVFARIGDRCIPAQNLANHVDVFAGARQGLRERLTVPALDHLGARDPQSENDPPVGQVVEGERRHGRRRRRARRELNNRGSESDPCGVGADPRQRGERVRAPGFGGPDRVEAEAFGLLCDRDEVIGALGAPVAELQT